MAKEKKWNDRWGKDSTNCEKFPYYRTLKKTQDTTNFTHIADKTRGSDYCVLVSKSLVKKLLVYKSIGINNVRLSKMVTCTKSTLAQYPLLRVPLNPTTWVSAKYINKDVWEFYIG